MTKASKTNSNMIKKMKKLTIEEAVKKVLKNRGAVEKEVQVLKDAKSAMAEATEQEIPAVSDNFHLLQRVLEIHGAMVAGHNLDLRTATDGKIYTALKGE